MKSPVPGDLVIEWAMSGPRSDRDTRVKALGYLIEHREEWYASEEQWKQFEAEDPENATEDNRSRDHAWYVQYGPDPADVCRWTNCMFLIVPAADGDDATWRYPPGVSR